MYRGLVRNSLGSGSMKKLVIAGTHDQAQLWIQNDLAKRSAAGETTLSMSEYVIIDSPTKLRGMIDPHGVFVGTWKQRADINDIIDVLHNNTRRTNHALDKVYSELSRTDFIGNTPDQAMLDELSDILLKDIDASVLKRIGMV